MKYKNKLGVLLLIFIISIVSFGKSEFEGTELKMKLSKNTALANGEDKIVVSYQIIDDNGVPLRNINKEDLKLSIDGVESSDFILTSTKEKEVEVVLTYENLKTSKKVKFIQDTRSLTITLSKHRILANGEDEVIIGVKNGNGEKWQDTVSLFINDKEVKTNTFKTTVVGEYKILAKSGRFESSVEKVTAYEKVNKLNLEANKLRVLANGKDNIIFTLNGKDQNGITREIKDFILIDKNNHKISNSGILTMRKDGIYKVKALYKGNYSNTITYESNYPNKLDAVSFFPLESTINTNSKIEIEFNLPIKNYENSIEVSQNRVKVEGNISYNNDLKTLLFTPTAPLEVGKEYVVILKDTILGLNENKLTNTHTFKFKVVEKITPKMVKVEKGKFILGDKTGKLWKFSSPTQEAFITYDYLIGETPVTFEIYDQYTREMKLPLVEDNDWGRKTRPVINISWNDAVSFLNWLSKEEGLPVAYDDNGNLIDSEGNLTRDITKVLGYRLPTEIEWEYAGRGGNKSKGTIFSGSDKVGDVAWYSENSSNKTHEVATKLQNELGIYDMSGNVWEWVNDNSGVYSGIERINSVGPKKKGLKILRGGSFNTIMSDTELAFRDELSPNTKDIYHGFRIAKTIKEEKSDGSNN